MTAVTAERYLLPHDGVGPGHDRLLDLPVTAVRLAVPEPERLARGLRALPDSPWLRVLDAFAQPAEDGSAGSVVLVLPRARAVLADVLVDGLPADLSELLAAALPAALDQLAGLGLGPASLRPEQIGVADDRQLLLVPQPDRSPEPEDVEQLSVRLRQSVRAEPVERPQPPPVTAPEPPPAPAPVPAAAAAPTRAAAPPPAAVSTPAPVPAAAAAPARHQEGPGPAGRSAPVPTPTPTPTPPTLQPPATTSTPPPARQPPPEVRTPGRPGHVVGDLASTSPGRRGAVQLPLRRGADAAGPDARAGRVRAALLAGAAALSVLAVSVALSGDEERVPPTGAQVAAPAVAAGTPLDEVTRRVAADPAALGPDGPELSARLQRLAGERGVRQAFAAAELLETVRVGRAEQTLRGGLLDEVQRAVTVVAQPGDLDALVALAQVDPAACGPGGPALTGRLQRLRDELSGETARLEAQSLIGVVRAAAAADGVSETCAALAVPVLRDLAVPDDVDALVRIVLTDPDGFGPGGLELLGRLQKLQTLDRPAARAEAADLVGVVEAGVANGSLTPALGDIALPVLRPLAEGSPAA